LRKIILSVLAAGAVAAISSTPVEAWGGCGLYRHPTPWGCRWNGPGWGGPVVYGGPGLYRGPGWYGGPGWRYRYWHRWRRWY